MWWIKIFIKYNICIPRLQSQHLARSSTYTANNNVDINEPCLTPKSNTTYCELFFIYRHIKKLTVLTATSLSHFYVFQRDQKMSSFSEITTLLSLILRMNSVKLLQPNHCKYIQTWFCFFLNNDRLQQSIWVS